ncbi:hypothetical protein NDU88_005309 [Pleurodeles waltl]|uniref:Uncharacterized protein n=1 Tax=Pleurodeles waltl TaxID=8319 RepID=A0AAV7TTL7_PLEWA|nr:hypothetical protein NDU88_005309 [Pleurodeles waltl]
MEAIINSSFLSSRFALNRDSTFVVTTFLRLCFGFPTACHCKANQSSRHPLKKQCLTSETSREIPLPSKPTPHRETNNLRHIQNGIKKTEQLCAIQKGKYTSQVWWQLLL